MPNRVAVSLSTVLLLVSGLPVVHANGPSQLASSSFFGRVGYDEATDIAVDSSGYVYVVGWSESFGFPSTGFDAFVLKLTPDGSQIVYTKYLGGSGFDLAAGVAIDAADNVYVAGHTTSPDFSLVSPFQSELRGSSDIWIAKLDPAGTVLYSSYYGGSSFENGNALAVSVSGDVYIAGSTGSADLPDVNGVQPRHAGGSEDGFVVKVRADGRGVEYATYLGGSSSDSAMRIVTDHNGYAFVVGNTASFDFPLAAPVQGAFGGGSNDVFVAKLSPDGRQLMFSTYLGGSSADTASALTLDNDGAVLVAGSTESWNYPTRDAYQIYKQGVWGDVFLTKLQADGGAVLFSTYLGGQSHDTALRMAVDRQGNIHLAGQTDSYDFPLVDATQDTINGIDGFVTELSGDGRTLVRSTSLGGSDLDGAFGLALSSTGDVWIAGRTDSVDFPVVNAFQPWHAGSADAFIARLTPFVEPNNQPLAVAGPDQQVFATGCSARVFLDGTTSSDPDGDTLAYVWSTDFAAATGSIAGVELPPGVHTVTLTVYDGRGGTATDTLAVTVFPDLTPTVVSGVTASPNVLTPPNHEMVPVSIHVDLTGGCTAATTCNIVEVSSNEPQSSLGDGDKSPDWELTGSLSLKLRAERDPRSQSGRVYTIVVECRDPLGKLSRTTAIVTVPRN